MVRVGVPREIAPEETYQALLPLYEAALRGEQASLEQYLEGGVIFDGLPRLLARPEDFIAGFPVAIAQSGDDAIRRGNLDRRRRPGMPYPPSTHSDYL